jgi:hypothetical protein
VSFLAVPNLEDSARLPALFSVICSISSVFMGMIYVWKHQEGVESSAEDGVRPCDPLVHLGRHHSWGLIGFRSWNTLNERKTWVAIQWPRYSAYLWCC